ncbi:putative RND superfamily exporter protein [Pseudomonas citronellolis]|nr:putative RND superfamily exporter protein [Pseudomonas citronellolis]MCP1667158.1 putative RND superfamily exporter protein [Pseudomonas citronellolis]MCP1698235.1 putative RND superfamily exporter protein [Pseudomonas citronellolis]MCP1705182.1 putative RND superfamily exporter protein [Pseudomonas citronellolis]MCP1798805.1 putative RND superfamily exporter protein [Pseudomonas citronellolis]
MLRFEEVEVGDPGPGQVRIRHVAVGLNYADTYFRNGTYPVPLPSGMGVEAAGVVVALVGVTLAAGVVTWAWSPIKFQADMGILLTFMFLWNMLGALLLIPALSHFLLNGRRL